MTLKSQIRDNSRSVENGGHLWRKDGFYLIGLSEQQRMY